MKTVSDSEIIDTSRGKKRIGALFDENAMLNTTNKDLLSVQADLLAALKSIARSDEFNGGTFVKELQHIARAAIAKAKGAA